MHLAGLVFSSGTFVRGSTPFTLFTVITSAIILVATMTFLALLVFEVYRSVKFAVMHEMARQLEIERLEKSLTTQRRWYRVRRARQSIGPGTVGLTA